MGDDAQRRAAGRTRTQAAAKDSAYMGRTLLLGELGAALCFFSFNMKMRQRPPCETHQALVGLRSPSSLAHTV